MPALERGLGRGLDSLLRSTRSDSETAARDSNKLALTQLVPGPHQPRRQFDESALHELATSIKNQGVVQPLIVRPKADSSPQLYEIVAGERRWRAAKLAGLTELPVVITTYSDDEAMTVALVENLQREDLNPVEEAQAFQTLRVTYKLSQEDLAAKLGKSRPAIANALRLLQLPPLILTGIAENRISSGHGRALLAVTDEEARDLLYQTILDQVLSVRDVEAAADAWKRTGALPSSITGQSGVRLKGGRSPKSLELKTVQKALRDAGHHGVLVSGDLEKGRITLPYTSRGELSHILSVLGIDGKDLGDALDTLDALSEDMDSSVPYPPDMPGSDELDDAEAETSASAFVASGETDDSLGALPSSLASSLPDELAVLPDMTPSATPDAVPNPVADAVSDTVSGEVPDTVLTAPHHSVMDAGAADSLPESEEFVFAPADMPSDATPALGEPSESPEPLELADSSELPTLPTLADSSESSDVPEKASAALVSAYGAEAGEEEAAALENAVQPGTPTLPAQDELAPEAGLSAAPDLLSDEEPEEIKEAEAPGAAAGAVSVDLSGERDGLPAEPDEPDEPDEPEEESAARADMLLSLDEAIEQATANSMMKRSPRA